MTAKLCYDASSIYRVVSSQMAVGIPQILAGAVIVVFASLYMLELTPRAEDGVVELGHTEVLLISKCERVFSHISDISNYPTVSMQ